ncbi:RNA polymerase subunit sigma-70 [Bailinhaonella thermotolerans]|uniref:RNA polymerase sigma factor n=1 Tax=Bailinhaonella thermotolerans TaxID=1070861 RepID=A0A3A4BBZ0_9ACTN|nr:RNA polymerase subunit sigma-70 [Bailinhaonella thermotolerans]RJL35616.1 sigma-70 family RNA polymerase sigma factor [Bailinhaonella thermotolerans]
MSDHVQPRAADAFAELIEPYRRELHLHCYRIVGSLADAEDLVQETLLAAWRGREGFEGRSSLRTWLYRIATNRSLNAVRDNDRRPRQGPVRLPEPTRLAEPLWLEPYPDSLLDDALTAPAGPEARYETRESVGLAFSTLLQRLPPRQRAAVVLCDVLGFRPQEAAPMLDSTPAAVKGLLQRARATLEASGDEIAAPPSPRERELAGLFATALEEGDTDGLLSLLTDDAWLTMPPEPYQYQGPVAIGEFLRYRAALRGGPLHAVHTRANGQPALGCYLPCQNGAGARPYGLLVLTTTEAGISVITWFRDTGVFPYFGLPRSL